MAKIKNWKTLLSQAGVTIWENTAAQKTLQLTKGVDGWYLSKWKIGKGFAEGHSGVRIGIYKNKVIGIKSAESWMRKHPKG
jgi:hypothetical protein